MFVTILIIVSFSFLLIRSCFGLYQDLQRFIKSKKLSKKLLQIFDTVGGYNEEE